MFAWEAQEKCREVVTEGAYSSMVPVYEPSTQSVCRLHNEHVDGPQVAVKQRFGSPTSSVPLPSEAAHYELCRAGVEGGRAALGVVDSLGRLLVRKWRLARSIRRSAHLGHPRGGGLHPREHASQTAYAFAQFVLWQS